MAKKPSKKGLETMKARAGYTFIAHWVIGLVLFFLYPLISSIWYGFNDVNIRPGRIETNFVGIKYFKDLLLTDPNYVNNLRDSVGSMLYSLPIIISVSLILAVLLNQEFKGRAIFRSIFFFPVIMANSAVMFQLQGSYINMPSLMANEEGKGMIDFTQILSQLDIPDQISPILEFLLTNTIDLIWSCGVAIVLFLAGLQSISPALYEVSKIEGANKWDEFWLITVPSLRHIISLVLIYTMIELFVDMQSPVISIAYNNMVDQRFGLSSASLWIYFLIVLALIGTVFVAYQRLCVKKWE